MKFDILKYLEEHDIDVHREGEKNVSRGWIGFNCPFPTCNDPSWHCGFNLEGNNFFCFHCGNKGSVYDLIMEIDSCNQEEARKIATFFWKGNDDFASASKFDDCFGSPPLQSTIALPKECSSEFPRLHWNYLKKRKFNPEKLIHEYRLKSCHTVGDYKYRIIIPCFLNNKLVTFTSLDVTGKQSVKYKHLSKSESVIPPKNLLYNIDSVKVGSGVIITEGVTDVWRVGGSTVATFGKTFTKTQINLLANKKLKRAIVAFDSDCHDKGEELGVYLSGFISDVRVVFIESGDPDTLDEESLFELRGMLSWKKK